MTNTKITILKQFLWMALFVVLVRLFFNLVFGNRTQDSVVSSLIEGGKLALWVLGFGLLNLVFDFRTLLKRSPKFFKNFSTALTIALTLTPEMAKNTLRVRGAAKLRSHRRGVHLIRSLLVPVLANAIDQSLTLAESMEARGFGRQQANRAGSINLRNLNFGYVLGKKVIANVSINLPAGSLTLLAGNTGSGKSTLLKVIQAKLPGVGFVSQFPRQSFVAATVFDELAFSLVQSGASEREIEERVSLIAEDFGLDLRANPLELSAGWQQRVAIAAALASGTKILLLDEPFSALDAVSTKLVLNTLTTLRHAGYTIVVAEHRIRPLLDLADSCVLIEDGQLKTLQPNLTSLVPKHSKTGQVRALVGANGSGKTSHLRKVAESVGSLVPQPASDLLFLDTVAAECTQADLDAKKPIGTTRETLDRFSNDFIETQNPRDLSEGQKLSLALSIQLSKDTELLLLDEPTLGFDTPSRQALVNLIHQIAESGVQVLVATHDDEFAEAITSDFVTLEELVNGANK